ncbi:Uncharacterised protein [Mycobacteroides abscessus]|nr:Uncharacterised protein [Mycobacteroides abscessus]
MANRSSATYISPRPTTYSLTGAAPAPGVRGMPPSHSTWRCASSCAASDAGSTPRAAAAAQSAPSARVRSCQAARSSSDIPRHQVSLRAYASFPQRASTSSRCCVWSNPSNMSSAMSSPPPSIVVIVRSTDAICRASRCRSARNHSRWPRSARTWASRRAVPDGGPSPCPAGGPSSASRIAGRPRPRSRRSRIRWSRTSASAS